MTETATAPTAASEPPKAKSPKKRGPKAASGGKPKTKPTHPPTATMVNSAIRSLKERGGSSLQAIKKYISATYKVDAEKAAPFIRKYINNAVAAKKLVQTKGSGAAGSFKLPPHTSAAASGEEGKKKPKAKKVASKAKPKKPAAEKKSPSKVKKAKKLPTTPKAPKPKKAKSPKKSAAKPKKPAPAKKVVKKTAAAKKAAPKKK